MFSKGDHRPPLVSVYSPADQPAARGVWVPWAASAMQRAAVVFTAKGVSDLGLGQSLAICVAGSASQAAQRGCSDESMPMDCPSMGAGTSVQADLSLAGRLVSTLLLVHGCSSWDLDARGPFHAGIFAPLKGACSPEQWYRVDLLLVLSSGEIPSLFGQTLSFTADLPAWGKGWLLAG